MSLSYDFCLFPGQACPESIEGKGDRGMVERVFQHPPGKGKSIVASGASAWLYGCSPRLLSETMSWIGRKG